MLLVLATLLTAAASPAPTLPQEHSVTVRDSLTYYYSRQDTSAVERLYRTKARTQQDRLLCLYRLYPMTLDERWIADIPSDQGVRSARELALISALWAYRAGAGPAWRLPTYGRRSERILDRALAADAREPYALLVKGQGLYYKPAIFGGDVDAARRTFEQLRGRLGSRGVPGIHPFEAEVWVWMAIRRQDAGAGARLQQRLLQRRPPAHLPPVPHRPSVTVLLAAVLVIHAGVALVLGANLIALARRRARALPTALPRVSVLVPARNEQANLAALLPTLFRQRGLELQVVVVDDASEDGTWDVLQSAGDGRLVAVQGDGPPAGWVGKPHALYQAARRATGEVYVFLDADAQLVGDGALAALVGRWLDNGGAGTALTGLPRYLDRGWGALLTSLVPFAVLAALPIPLVPRTSSPSLSALNGQVWLLGADDYGRLKPHEAVKDQVLEDVMIGRFPQEVRHPAALRGPRRRRRRADVPLVCRGVARLPEERLPPGGRRAGAVRGVLRALQCVVGGAQRALARRRRVLDAPALAGADQAGHRPVLAASPCGSARSRPSRWRSAPRSSSTRPTRTRPAGSPGRGGAWAELSR